jgi:hypothetical protein
LSEVGGNAQGPERVPHTHHGNFGIEKRIFC